MSRTRPTTEKNELLDVIAQLHRETCRLRDQVEVRDKLAAVMERLTYGYELRDRIKSALVKHAKKNCLSASEVAKYHRSLGGLEEELKDLEEKRAGIEDIIRCEGVHLPIEQLSMEVVGEMMETDEDDEEEEEDEEEEKKELEAEAGAEVEAEAEVEAKDKDKADFGFVFCPAESEDEFEAGDENKENEEVQLASDDDEIGEEEEGGGADDVDGSSGDSSSGHFSAASGDLDAADVEATDSGNPNQETEEVASSGLKAEGDEAEEEDSEDVLIIAELEKMASGESPAEDEAAGKVEEAESRPEAPAEEDDGPREVSPPSSTFGRLLGYGLPRPWI